MAAQNISRVMFSETEAELARFFLSAVVFILVALGIALVFLQIIIPDDVGFMAIDVLMEVICRCYSE